MSTPTERMQAALALHQSYEVIRLSSDPPAITLPEEAPENPKEWVVMDTVTIATDQGALRIMRGTRYDNLAEVGQLQQAGVDIRAFA